MANQKPKLWRLIWYKLGGPEYPKTTEEPSSLGEVTLKSNYDHLLADYERLQEFTDNLVRELDSHSRYCGLNLSYVDPRKFSKLKRLVGR